jgi:hypothetical protein
VSAHRRTPKVVDGGSPVGSEASGRALIEGLSDETEVEEQRQILLHLTVRLARVPRERALTRVGVGAILVCMARKTDQWRNKLRGYIVRLVQHPEHGADAHPPGPVGGHYAAAPLLLGRAASPMRARMRPVV